MRALVPLVLLAGCATPTRSEPRAEPPRPAPALVVANEPVEDTPLPVEVEPVEPSAAPAQAPDPRAESEREAAPVDPWSTPIGAVAGRSISVGELVVEWHQAIGADAYLLLDKLVATRLAFAEAERLGLVLTREDVDARVADERERLDREAERQGGGLTTDEFVARELAMEPARYYERVRAGVIRQTVAERVVRAFTLAEENIGVSLIVTADVAAMDGVRARLAAGDPFAEVARASSIDDSAPRGGRVPFLVRQEGSALTRAAFELAPGATSQPVALAGHQFLVRLDERRAPLDGLWDVVGDDVRASLAREPVLESEFLHWKLAMERRYPVDLRPFLELVGAPRSTPKTP